eukprot:5704569-Pyramimonas_sp.AAC.1
MENHNSCASSGRAATTMFLFRRVCSLVAPQASVSTQGWGHLPCVHLIPLQHSPPLTCFASIRRLTLEPARFQQRNPKRTVLILLYRMYPRPSENCKLGHGSAIITRGWHLRPSLAVTV